MTGLLTDMSKVEMRVLAAMSRRGEAKSTPEHRIRSLITRLEQTIPFPMHVEEFYMSLFPPGYMDVAATRNFNIQLRNVRAVTSSGTEAVVMVGPDKFIRCTFSKPMPTPHASINTTSSGLIVCNKDHPAIEAILKWHAEAVAYEARVSAAQSMMLQVLESTAVTAWEELHKAIGTKKPRYATLRARQRLSELMDAEDKKIFDDMLAAALLLPDVKTPHAWVGLLGR